MPDTLVTSPGNVRHAIASTGYKPRMNYFSAPELQKLAFKKPAKGNGVHI
jgi:hypothetical protein